MGGRTSGVVLAIAVTAVGGLMGALVGGSLGAAILGGVSLLFAVPFGLAVARAEP